MSRFDTDPLRFVSGVEEDRATSCVASYLQHYTGAWFGRLADPDPDRITPADLAAVTTLSVNVPPRVAIWLAQPAGHAEVGPLLEAIPSGPIHQVERRHLAHDSAAEALWELLQARRWPEGEHHATGVGSVIAGKLLAAKRPGLIPIWDEQVGKALGGPGREFWLAMWECFQDDRLVTELVAVRQAALEACRDRGVEVPAEPSLLRTLDIVIWMRTYGADKSPDSAVRALARTPVGPA